MKHGPNGSDRRESSGRHAGDAMKTIRIHDADGECVQHQEVKARDGS